MGFMESLGRAMSKLFSKQMQGWEDNLTEEMIDDLERQGCDVTELRQKYNAKIAAEEERQHKIVENSINMMALDKLEPHKVTPRDITSEFMADSAQFIKAGNKKKEKLTNAPIVYTAIVQANNKLWEPGCNESQGMVAVFALDKEHMYNKEWLLSMAEKISKLKRAASVPNDCQKFVETLRDDYSYFCFKLGDSISEGADVWCATYTVDPKHLPGGYLPADRIMPFFLLDAPKVNMFVEFEPIPTKYYTK